MTKHGVGVPIQDNDPDEWAEQYPDIPFVTWNSVYCHHENFLPTQYSRERMAPDCNDGRPVLLFNEPEFSGQANLTPQEAVDELQKYRHWRGPVYGCGNSWFHDGYKWMREFLSVAGDDIAILSGLHIHPYAAMDNYTLYLSHADRWAELAAEQDWPIILSEWGLVGGGDEDRDTFLAYLIEKFSPVQMYIFSWRYHLIPELDLANEDGTLTEIGEWWFEMANTRARLWLPFVGR